jgi:RNA polymerase sigma-70 factor (ECF subfamily)
VVERRAGEADEAALVRAVASGSEEALAALYDRHADGIHAVAIRLSGDRGIAEEVVQETFLALWNRAEQFDPAVASLATWLRSIARNRTIDRLRAIGRRPALVPLAGPADRDGPDGVLDRMGDQAAVVGGAAPAAAPEAVAEAASAREAINAALAAMPETERTVILLAYREELTQQEIAGRLGWPLGTVKTRTRRALARRRGLLAADGEESGARGPGHEDAHGAR